MDEQTGLIRKLFELTLILFNSLPVRGEVTIDEVQSMEAHRGLRGQTVSNSTGPGPGVRMDGSCRTKDIHRGDMKKGDQIIKITGCSVVYEVMGGEKSLSAQAESSVQLMSSPHNSFIIY